MEIRDLLKDYVETATQLELLEAKKDELRSLILNKLGEMGVDKYLDEDYSAAIAAKETFKYIDETGMVNWLNANGYGNFVNAKVNTTALNKELKAGAVALNEGLKGMFVHNFSNQLTVKRNG